MPAGLARKKREVAEDQWKRESMILPAKEQAPVVIAEKPSPFCVVRMSDPIEKRRAKTMAWVRNVMRFNDFWGDPARQNNGKPAWLRYWCGKCSGDYIHDVNTHGPIATCPKCGNRVDLRPEGKFGGQNPA